MRMQNNHEVNSILLKCILLPDLFVTIQNLNKIDKEILSSYFSTTYPAYYGAIVNALECASDHDSVLNAECNLQVAQALQLLYLPDALRTIIQRIADWEVYDSKKVINYYV
jgi:hypothetical protein